jgi:rhamnogalacturonyl hydrolase YesR
VEGMRVNICTRRRLESVIAESVPFYTYKRYCGGGGMQMMAKKQWRRWIIGITLLFVLSVRSNLSAQTALSGWPAGMSPQEVGKLVAEHFVKSPHQNPKRIAYPEVCAWYGALKFAEATGDVTLQKELIERFQPLLDQREAGLVPEAGKHVDLSMFGALPLELYRQTKDGKYLTMGKNYADEQWAHLQPDGLTDETRFWIDDMYMITILQVQAYRATGDKRYLDRAALEMAAYLDRLQQPNGLFYHAPDVPFFWGRGNGWFAVGMAELLKELPEDHALRPRILQGYRMMMAALLKYQGKDGMWRQLIDHEEAWPEASGSGMFAFAVTTGVKQGWLSEVDYGTAARKAWLGLAGYVDQNADVTNVCVGTDKLNSLDYYLLRRRRTGDFHGQAPLLWAAAALLAK